MTKKMWVIYTYTCSPMFSIDVRRPMYLLIVGSHYCVMRFAYALHMPVCQQNFVLFPCLYIEFFELVLEVNFHYCTSPPCHKIDLFKRPFRGSRSEHLDNASGLLVSLIFLYPQKILISVRWHFELQSRQNGAVWWEGTAWTACRWSAWPNGAARRDRAARREGAAWQAFPTISLGEWDLLSHMKKLTLLGNVSP